MQCNSSYARSSYSEYCHTISAGPERNRIRDKLRDINWRDLVNELDLINQLTSIGEVCSKEHDPMPCRLAEVLERFIQSQPSESCKETVEKIVVALEQLENHYQATELRKIFLTGESCLHVSCIDALG